LTDPPLSVRYRLLFEEVIAASKPIAGPTSAPPEKTDVVIIGAGLVGPVAANLLGLYGVNTVLIERNKPSSDQPLAMPRQGVGQTHATRSQVGAPAASRWLATRDQCSLPMPSASLFFGEMGRE
jgi:glycine/D-amino acid oxidase-like deaminating enzyme